MHASPHPSDNFGCLVAARQAADIPALLNQTRANRSPEKATRSGYEYPAGSLQRSPARGAKTDEKRTTYSTADITVMAAAASIAHSSKNKGPSRTR